MQRYAVFAVQRDEGQVIDITGRLVRVGANHDGVVHVESLPKTGTGKYQKHVLRQQFKDFFAEVTDESRVRAVPQA